MTIQPMSYTNTESQPWYAADQLWKVAARGAIIWFCGLGIHAAIRVAHSAPSPVQPTNAAIISQAAAEILRPR